MPSPSYLGWIAKPTGATHPPAVTQLVADGFAVTVLYWAHASRELREAATAFHALDGYIRDLALA